MDARLADAHRLGEVAVAETGIAPAPYQDLGLGQQLRSGVSHGRSIMVGGFAKPGREARRRDAQLRASALMPLTAAKIYLLDGSHKNGRIIHERSLRRAILAGYAMIPQPLRSLATRRAALFGGLCLCCLPRPRPGGGILHDGRSRAGHLHAARPRCRGDTGERRRHRQYRLHRRRKIRARDGVGRQPRRWGMAARRDRETHVEAGQPRGADPCPSRPLLRRAGLRAGQAGLRRPPRPAVRPRFAGRLLQDASRRDPRGRQGRIGGLPDDGGGRHGRD